VDAAAARRQAVVGDQERRLIDAVDIGLLWEQFGELGAGISRKVQRRRQNVRQVEQLVGLARRYLRREMARLIRAMCLVPLTGFEPVTS
ncbi:MAG: hypothetical protein ACSLE4_10990, partial [Methyloceanibacter sp.]|uniref:hypothetical protein n=1 Tax=Methyloceanibacter sp. TaxID=1965321 RepID=UPI003EE16801